MFLQTFLKNYSTFIHFKICCFKLVTEGSNIQMIYVVPNLFIANIAALCLITASYPYHTGTPFSCDQNVIPIRDDRVLCTKYCITVFCYTTEMSNVLCKKKNESKSINQNHRLGMNHHHHLPSRVKVRLIWYLYLYAVLVLY
mmetsp:Transcript_21474/g.59687  ORF Transcript_21474/g.59687 Transcript_21474/m.59687 type:complete len:142 (+) Transcript_21474:3267-3692(+)